MDAQQNTWWQKIGWLVLIWLASVATLACAAYAMRLLMRAAGMSS
jgi:hypothetical protein